MAPRIFFLFNILIFINLFKYKTIEAHARAILSLSIWAVGSVSNIYYWPPEQLSNNATIIDPICIAKRIKILCTRNCFWSIQYVTSFPDQIFSM